MFDNTNIGEALNPWHDCPMASAFWDRVITAFRDAGLDTAQNSIASTLGVTQGAVSKWARGSGHPTLKKCIRIAEITHTNVEWLLTGSGSQNQEQAMDDLTKQMLRTWADLPPAARREFLAYVEFRVSRSEKPRSEPDDNPPPGKRNTQ